MFLRNCWYMAAWDHEQNDGRLLERTLPGDPVLLYRVAGGRGGSELLHTGIRRGHGGGLDGQVVHCQCPPLAAGIRRTEPAPLMQSEGFSVPLKRDADREMMLCISRSHSPNLVLDS